MEFICLINIFYRYGKQALESMLEPYDLNMNELIVVLVIKESPGISQSYLSKFIGMDKGNFSAFLTHLEKKGWLYRTKSPDQPKHKLCYLTEAGQDRAPDLEALAQDWQALCFNQVTDPTKTTFMQVSHQVSNNLFQALNVRW